jgi:hypothetical protein
MSACTSIASADERGDVIPAAKLGNRGGFRFKREDLDGFLERRRAEGSDPT